MKERIAMKKYFELKPSFSDLKEKVVVLQDKEDKKNILLILAVVTAVLAAITLGVVYLMKTRMDEEYDEDWDYDWDDLEDECCGDECSCTDSDVDDSVKVEQA